ncbi:hypothetical protein [Maridesulfovibrio salexigens]|uniref:G domain-containing protein n=1 Tax=Maridesulfovibrio salexigens (strain ATCC 14822 / DSM 2638 / NCIMB 8403 / VKM B-1763) TaxID=526222 RepID=C6BVZ5_MARSD|nr:hypothetical protein [Maridesulfovibrio salexigens]ACS80198.1 hypothetical protein Desal_2139 [Maridesulfovibrio salexigens DSM 2638]
MKDKLLIAVLGHSNSGKSTTWYKLFGKSRLNTGSRLRELVLNETQSIDVFLINGSPEERGKTVEEILRGKTPEVVLCSTQYRKEVTATFDYFFDNGYDVYVQWLNPGFKDKGSYTDRLGIEDYLIRNGATVHKRDGQCDPSQRVQEIREFILQWGLSRKLVYANSIT